MAAPIESNTLDFTGRWRLNQRLSDHLEPAFALQGIPWIIRKVINRAELEHQYMMLPLEEHEGSSKTRFIFKQTVRPGGFEITHEYIVDGENRTNTVPIFGEVTVHCVYVGHNKAKEMAFGKHIESVDDDHAAMVEVVQNEEVGWKATNV